VAIPLSLPPSPRMVELARGVYAAIRDEPLGLAGNANSLVIVRDSDVVVVDAQFTRQATLETIAAIRRLTPKPVGLVINTHWHDDHMAGNQVYQDSFPGVRFLMHANTAADFATLGAQNRAGNLQAGPAMADRYARLLAMGLGIDSTPATEAERASVSNAVRIFRQYVAEAGGFRAVAPDDTVHDRLTLRQGKTTIDIRWFGCGNTRGDLVVYLPGEGIVATGDLVVAPVPFAFGSYPATWPAALDSIIELRPRVLVPGHGPVMRDLSYVRTVRDMLFAARDQAHTAAARGDSLEQALRLITLDDYRGRLAGNEKWMNWMFRNFFLRPTVARAFEAARTGGAPAGCRESSP
jgi:cyclase